MARIDPERLWRSLMDLAKIGATPKGGVRRITLTDDGDHTVRKFSPDGALLMTLGTPGVPSDTGYDGKVTSSIMRLGPPFNRPTKAAIGPNGDIFGVDIGAGSIVRYTYNGIIPERQGSSHPYTKLTAAYETADGWMVFSISAQRSE